MPKLSIIVPIYNVEQYIHMCVDSILNQKFEDFELILVDDGSPDGCPQICDAYAAQDSRIKVIHKENGGLSDARNAGLDIACGEYIGFVDSDDWIDPMMYENMLAQAESTGADLVACGIRYYDEINDKIDHWQHITHDQTISSKSILQDFLPYHFSNLKAMACNKIYAAEIFHDLRFPFGVLYEDSHLILDILVRSKQITLLKDYYYNYIATRVGSIMNSAFSERCFSILDAWKHHYAFFLSRCNSVQAALALDRYLNEYIKHYLVIRLKHKELMPKFSSYKKLGDHFRILSCRQICEMKKLTFLLMYVSPKHALKLCMKYFPECIHPVLTQEQ